MKKFLFVLLTILFLCNFNLIAQDSTRVEDENTNNLNISMFGGIGVILKGADFNNYFGNTPIYNFGVEYPITKLGYWSLRGSVHFWNAMSQDNLNETLYYKFSDNLYGQLGTSIQLNWYYLVLDNINCSMHLGYFFSLLNQGTYSGLDLGLNFGYKISNSTNILLEYNRWGYGGEGSPAMFDPIPCLLNSITINIKFLL